MADAVWLKGHQFFDDSGDPLNAGTLNIYDATTTNERTVYQDDGAGTPWTQPITLNSAGRLTAGVYVPTGDWKFILKNSAGSTLATEDNIPGAVTIPSSTFALPETPTLSKSANYTVTTSDLGHVVKADSTGGNFTLSLPSAVTAGDGANVWVQHVGSAGKVTVAPNGVQTINGAASVSLIRPYSFFRLVSDGANWTAEGADRLFATLSKTTTYTVTTADVGKLIKGDATSGAFSITLPAATSAGDGFEVTIQKIDATTNAVTVDGDGTETINGAATLALSTQWWGAQLRCDGSNWIARQTFPPDANPTESIIVACSDEVTAITAATGKVKFRMPYAFTLTSVRASLSTTQASGNIFTVDINEGDSPTSILSTKITINNSEKTSTTAATPAVISDTSLADDAEISVDVDQIGDGTAKGLKVYLIGRRT